MCNISSQVVSSLIALLQYYVWIFPILSVFATRSWIQQVMMYGFGSKYEGLVFAKIKVKGLWLFLYRVLLQLPSWNELTWKAEALLEEAQNWWISHSPLTVSVYAQSTLQKYKSSCLELSKHVPLEPPHLVGTVHNTLRLWGLKFRSWVSRMMYVM